MGCKSIYDTGMGQIKAVVPGRIPGELPGTLFSAAKESDGMAVRACMEPLKSSDFRGFIMSGALVLEPAPISNQRSLFHRGSSSSKSSILSISRCLFLVAAIIKRLIT